MRRMNQKTRMFINLGYMGLIIGCSAMVLLPLISLLAYIFIKGFRAINLSFFLALPKPVGEVGGGISNAIVGTLQIVSIAAVIATPLGVAAGIYLAENATHTMAKWAKVAIDTLQGVPSIVVGVIAYAWVVRPLGHFSALSGSVALAMIMFPVVAKATEETVRLVPVSIKEAAIALGAPYYRTIIRVIVPSSASGIVAGILLSVARIMGETAPLLFTAFGNPFMNLNITKPVNAMPLLIYNYATSPYDDWQMIAWGTSLVLVVLVLILSMSARLLVRR